MFELLSFFQKSFSSYTWRTILAIHKNKFLLFLEILVLKILPLLINWFHGKGTISAYNQTEFSFRKKHWRTLPNSSITVTGLLPKNKPLSSVSTQCPELCLQSTQSQ